MFLTGPKVVRAALGEDVTMEQLGGPRVQEASGVAQLTTAGIDDAIDATRELLAFLPQRVGWPAPVVAPAPAIGDPASVVPAESRRVYDVRDVVGRIADEDSLLELSARWAPNMVTGLCRIEGRPVGLIANQPRRSVASSTPPARRRRPASSIAASASASPCWSWSTPRASCPAAARSASA